MRKFGRIVGINQTLIKGCMMQPAFDRPHITSWSFANDRKFMIVGWRPDKKIWDFVTQRSHGGKGIARPQLAQIAVDFGPKPTAGYYSLGVTRYTPSDSDTWLCSDAAVHTGADVYFPVDNSKTYFTAQLWDDSISVRELSPELSTYFTSATADRRWHGSVSGCRIWSSWLAAT